MSSLKFTPFASALKAAVTKINNITSEMDKKVDFFVDEVISKIVDYDDEFFTRGGNEETDKTDMKESIKDLFKMFQPEKKKSYSGYILYCQEERSNIKERNPELNPAQVTSALGAQWKALDADEKAEYNLKAKSMKPMTDEEKAEKKAEKRSSSKKPVVKDDDEEKGAEAGKASKKAPSKKTEDKSSKKEPSKKTEDKASKKAPSKKTEEKKEDNASKKAPSKKTEEKKEDNASKKAPSKKTEKTDGSSTVKKSPMKSPNTQPKTEGFNFSGPTSPIVRFKKINLDENTEGKRWRYDPESGLCFEMEKDVLVARYTTDGVLTWLKDLPENIKNWAKKAGYEVPEEDEEIGDIQLEDELSDDEELDE
jgi:hypothetical protein